MVLRKFAAARIAEGVRPSGGTKSRFSTWPSAVTRTTSARSGLIETNSICRIGAAVFGASTRLAPCVRPESMSPARSRMVVRSASLPPSERSISVRSAPETSPTSRMPSTKRRRPSWVGIRPAETCGESSRPSCSRSCITLRMVAAETPSLTERASVREPTGSPVSR